MSGDFMPVNLCIIYIEASCGGRLSVIRISIMQLEGMTEVA